MEVVKIAQVVIHYTMTPHYLLPTLTYYQSEHIVYFSGSTFRESDNSMIISLIYKVWSKVGSWVGGWVGGGVVVKALLRIDYSNQNKIGRIIES